MMLLTYFSRSLDGSGVFDMGLRLFIKVMSPFLGIGVTLDMFLEEKECRDATLPSFSGIPFFSPLAKKEEIIHNNTTDKSY